MSNRKMIAKWMLKATSVALALGLSMGAASGPAAAYSGPSGQMAPRGGELIFGFAGVNDGSASSSSRACEGRLGGAILGNFADASDSPWLGSHCRY
jgi:hypothetical protein